MTTTKKRMTPDEIEAEIHEMAQSGEGMDRRWALGRLGAAQTSLVIPKPLSDEEVDRRTSRILKAIGRDRASAAWRIAFNERRIEEALNREIMREYRAPVTLEQLYRMFPECPKDEYGFPPDWPHKKSQTRKRQFVIDMAFSLNNKRKAHEQGVPEDQVT